MPYRTGREAKQKAFKAEDQVIHFMKSKQEQI